MPRKRWIDKNNATTFQLFYRPQDDPLLHDESISDRALFPVSAPKGDPSNASGASQTSAKALRITDLEDDLDFEAMRDNEGEAAEYGIYYDDTSYDYMQHLRDMGEGSGESHFVDAASVKVQGKGKGKGKIMKLEDALRETSLEDDDVQGSVSSVYDDNLSSFSRSTGPRTYQDQQDVPDAIAGFQPDMDPRLREVLEALEDDAYVDEKDEEDIFGALTKGARGQEVDLDEFETAMDGEDDGWESDATERPPPTQQEKELSLPPDFNGDLPVHPNDDGTFPATSDAATASAEDGDWLREFAKFKRDTAQKKSSAPNKVAAAAVAQSTGAPSAIQAPPSTLYTLNGTPLRKKKRKGALTNPSAYSMTSSSLARTEGQQLLDARFEKVEAMYALDEFDDEDEDNDGGMSLASGKTGLSRASKMSTLSTSTFADTEDIRSDFDGMMDGFLDGWDKGHPGGGMGKRKGAKGKRGKNGNEVLGIKMLDEVRAELGPARLPGRAQKA